jgi:hypothetical protein
VNHVSKIHVPNANIVHLISNLEELHQFPEIEQIPGINFKNFKSVPIPIYRKKLPERETQKQKQELL